MTKNIPYIVDLEGLAKALSCSKQFLYEGQRWRSLPHVDFGGAKFDVCEVWEYLKNANKTAGRNLQSQGEDQGSPNKIKKRVQDSKRGKGLGTSDSRAVKKPTTPRAGDDFRADLKVLVGSVCEKI